MYIDVSKSGKYRRVLLRESYRENGKVKKRTVGNLSDCSNEEIFAIQVALKDAEKLPKILAESKDVKLLCGKSVGAAFVAVDMAEKTGVKEALGNTKDGKLALWQVVARLLEQGSRLSAVRLHEQHALVEAIGIESEFCEDDLYKNLAWLAEHQAEIEDRLFKNFQKKHPNSPVDLFLYDVTSNYFEGQHNELSAFGYNRDGKKQIVIGLLCDKHGHPVSVQVFPGNTCDTKTFKDQIDKIATRFKIDNVTMVGDRGMIKSPQQDDLTSAKFNYITALTNKQISVLEKQGVIQLELFEDKICEIKTEDKRYVLRRNPVRATEIENSRMSKESCLRKLVIGRNKYLQEHSKAKPETALKMVSEKIKKLKCKWLNAEIRSNKLVLICDTEILEDISRFDGCYVITTNLNETRASSDEIHMAYKNLAKVERAFRESKTGHLELRPIHVRTKLSTRGHVFVVMLAYLLRMEFQQIWKQIDTTVEEGLNQLSKLCSVKISKGGHINVERIPSADGRVLELLTKANCSLPETIISRYINVSTRKKLATAT